MQQGEGAQRPQSVKGKGPKDPGVEAPLAAADVAAPAGAMHYVIVLSLMSPFWSHLGPQCVKGSADVHFRG